MRAWYPFIAATLILSAPTALLAQENAAYTDAHAKATAAFEAGQFAECADLFKRAFSAEPRGNLLYNIALCYEKAGDLPNAVGYYQRFMEAVPTSPKRPAIAQHVAELQAQLADQYQEVMVSSNPSGAQIFVDDKSRGSMGETPATFKLFPGTYNIIVEKQGYERARQRIELRKGASAQVDLKLFPSDQVGTITLRVTERDADVTVDGKNVGRSPLDEPLRLPRGGHEIVVEKPGFGVWKKQVEVAAGQKVQIQASLAVGEAGGGEGEAEAAEAAAAEEPGNAPSGGGGGSLFGGKRLWPTIVMGAGLLAIGGGVLTGVSASGLHDQLEEKQKKGDLIAKADVDTGNTLTLTTNVLLGVGGAALIGGAVWWFMAGDGVETSSELGVGLAPNAEPGVAVWGTF